MSVEIVPFSRVRPKLVEGLRMTIWLRVTGLIIKLFAQSTHVRCLPGLRSPH